MPPQETRRLFNVLSEKFVVIDAQSAHATDEVVRVELAGSGLDGGEVANAADVDGAVGRVEASVDKETIGCFLTIC